MKFDEIQINENLYPCILSKRHEFLEDIWEVKQSWTGRNDAMQSNTFLEEACQLIINAINLFEKGYFDCAYYSIRQALEVATTMVYLVDIEEEKREEKFTQWRTQQRFPMDRDMQKYLAKNGYIFSDMRQKMHCYFREVEDRRKLYNKYVHKQGFKYFYVSRKYSRDRDEVLLNECATFEECINFSIGVVAVMRLSIDPFPVLLMDEEIFYRTGDTITLPYSEEFVDKYIGEQTIQEYKTTELYKSHYSCIIKEERKNLATIDVVKNQYINEEKIDHILEQVHLLSEIDFVAVMIVKILPHISKVYVNGNIWWYFTNNKTNKKHYDWSGENFRVLEEEKKGYNHPYEEVYISCMTIAENTYFIEHNNPLMEYDINLIKELEVQLTRGDRNLKITYERP
nr:teicoplanin resistance protein VanZ [uncultured Niameybacter sp.]